jgi:methylphosphotriester-DNA--protein-cysteine methyltransferase
MSLSFFGATIYAIRSLGHGLHEASPGDADATRNCVFSTEKAAAGNADCGCRRCLPGEYSSGREAQVVESDGVRDPTAD